ncbi:germin-like protein subfamily 3 member 4 [Neltuma alba]|uniref:germin-like protein subfamily 3 member 4 n=1 Tax=Neltuma alba TaxID=207710 RepID=UPI0010A45435|nr:germin-like protein subfamily 3 member 4 [Prosopis alba]
MKYLNLLSFVFFIVFTSIQVCLADCDNLQDSCPAVPPEKQTIFINGLPCKNPENTTAQDFKTSELSEAGSTDNIFSSSMKIVGASEFPGLNTLGLSIGRIDIDADGLITPHYHPRATEVIFVTKGKLVVGFLDTKNQLFQKFLSAGEVFVFPKALLHFILNRGFEAATVISVYSSQNPGLVSFTSAAFDNTLESIEKLKIRLTSLSASEIHNVNDLSLSGLDNIHF